MTRVIRQPDGTTVCRPGAISASDFEEATGREPEQDDLQRANCPDAGKFGHYQCGWCDSHGGPAWECGCFVDRLPQPKVRERPLPSPVSTGSVCGNCGSKLIKRTLDFPPYQCLTCKEKLYG